MGLEGGGVQFMGLEGEGVQFMGLEGDGVQDPVEPTIFNVSIFSAYNFWHISRENNNIITDLFFHEGDGLVF